MFCFLKQMLTVLLEDGNAILCTEFYSEVCMCVCSGETFFNHNYVLNKTRRLVEFARSYKEINSYNLLCYARSKLNMLKVTNTKSNTNSVCNMHNLYSHYLSLACEQLLLNCLKATDFEIYT